MHPEPRMQPTKSITTTTSRFAATSTVVATSHLPSCRHPRHPSPPLLWAWPSRLPLSSPPPILTAIIILHPSHAYRHRTLPLSKSAPYPAARLKELTATLKTIAPRRSIQKEWLAIRRVAEAINEHASQSTFPTLMEALLNILEGTFPGRDNKSEWASIRAKCIALEGSEPTDQFYGVVRVLFGITPGHSNRQEWARIRTTCLDILQRKPSTAEGESVTTLARLL